MSRSSDADLAGTPTIGPLVIEVLDEDSGLAEVEWLSPGGEALTFELPIAWLPAGTQEGDGFALGLSGGALTFRRDPEAARQLRERSKQTLLDFSDETEPDDEHMPGGGER